MQCPHCKYEPFHDGICDQCGEEVSQPPSGICLDVSGDLYNELKRYACLNRETPEQAARQILTLYLAPDRVMLEGQ